MAVLAEERRHLKLQLPDGDVLSLDYLLRRGQRRTLGLTIDTAGLRVNVPQRTRVREIEDWIQANVEWITARLDERHRRVQAAEAQRQPLRIEEGAMIPVLGEPHRLELSHLSSSSSGLVYLPAFGGQGRLRLTVGPCSPVLPLFMRGFQTLALRHLEERVTVFAPRLGLPVPELGLTQARTRWGSCTQRGQGRIRLHWKLFMLPPELGDYVVVHELAHLLEMNHSPAFWAQVARLCPEWPNLRRRLNEEGMRLPEFLAP